MPRENESGNNSRPANTVQIFFFFSIKILVNVTLDTSEAMVLTQKGMLHPCDTAVKHNFLQRSIQSAPAHNRSRSAHQYTPTEESTWLA